MDLPFAVRSINTHGLFIHWPICKLASAAANTDLNKLSCKGTLSAVKHGQFYFNLVHALQRRLVKANLLKCSGNDACKSEYTMHGTNETNKMCYTC